MAAISEAVDVHPIANPTNITFSGGGTALENATLLDFWRWAFSDLCDDDIKGIFAEWMVGALLGVRSRRRVSWANSDIVVANKRIEVKSTAIWQSWKLVNPDGTRMNPFPAPKELNAHLRFSGLQARTAERVARADELRQFKSDVYVFCLHNQTDPSAWDAWNLEQWEFYVMTRQELINLKVGNSISLMTLRKVRTPMSAMQFKIHMQELISTNLQSGA